MLATRGSALLVHRNSHLEDEDMALIDEVMSERLIQLRRASSSVSSPRSESVDHAGWSWSATASSCPTTSFDEASERVNDDCGKLLSSQSTVDDVEDKANSRSHLTHPTLSMLDSSDSFTSLDDSNVSTTCNTAPQQSTEILYTTAIAEVDEGSSVDGRRSSLSTTKFVVRKGWIEKCGQRFKTWKWRYFELTRDGCLRYYTAEDKTVCKGTIHVAKTTKNDIVIQTHVSSREFFFILSTPHRNYLLSTATERAMTRAQAGPGRWDPLRNTVHLTVDDNHQPHKWRGYDDPHDAKTMPMAGVLLKRGHVRTNWVQRYFKLEKLDHHPVLRYYSDGDGRATPKGAISLVNASVSAGVPFCCDGRRNYFVVLSGSLDLHLNALTERDMRRWIHALRKAIEHRPMTPPRPMHVVATHATVVASHLPHIHFTFASKAEFETLQLESRGDALVVSSTSAAAPSVPLGAQLIRVQGVSLGLTIDAARLQLARATYPLQCEFICAPAKRGEMIKRSRSSRTLTSWKTREIVVEHGCLTYIAWHEVRGSFSLAGCYLQLPDVPNRPHCILVGRSPTDKLVLQASSDDERISWAATLHCSILMASHGLSVAGLASNDPFFV
ncbi:hypothetical protein DYB32_004708 [Aphanomyces invadans]|uniref:PH domain-containing protein n=1 Tax=Aphanomyces invadans TaxID=157072 RepID=A0A3R6WM30_9STRA|nr:hypothetical protein DYB32_004708 [Aphanomyces invadans]